VVDGPGGWCRLQPALACDVPIAPPGAVFDARFTALHLLPGGGHTWLLERAVGRQAATAISLFGERLDAASAREADLVWRAFPDPATASEAALAMAGRLGRQDRDYTEAFTRLLRSAGLIATHQQAVEHERYLQRWSATRPAFLAGVRAMRATIEGRRGRPDHSNPDESTTLGPCSTAPRSCRPACARLAVGSPASRVGRRRRTYTCCVVSASSASRSGRWLLLLLFLRG